MSDATENYAYLHQIRIKPFHDGTTAELFAVGSVVKILDRTWWIEQVRRRLDDAPPHSVWPYEVVLREAVNPNAEFQAEAREMPLHPAVELVYYFARTVKSRAVGA